MDIKSIRENVYDLYRYAKYGDNRSVKSMIKFYEQGAEAPSISSVIMRDEFKKQMDKDTEKIYEELYFGTISGEDMTDELARIDYVPFEVSMLETHPEVQPALEKFTESFEKIYPKTHILRQLLINNDRVLWDSVTPKANWFKKFKIMRQLKLY